MGWAAGAVGAAGGGEVMKDRENRVLALLDELDVVAHRLVEELIFDWPTNDKAISQRNQAIIAEHLASATGHGHELRKVLSRIRKKRQQSGPDRVQ